MIDVIEKAREDQKATILYYKYEGREEGKAEGLEQGEHKKQLEIARNLVRMNLSVDQIQQATGLSVQEIAELK